MKKIIKSFYLLPASATCFSSSSSFCPACALICNLCEQNKFLLLWDVSHKGKTPANQQYRIHYISTSTCLSERCWLWDTCCYVKWGVVMERGLLLPFIVDAVWSLESSCLSPTNRNKRKELFMPGPWRMMSHLNAALRNKKITTCHHLAISILSTPQNTLDLRIVIDFFLNNSSINLTPLRSLSVVSVHSKFNGMCCEAPGV